MRVIIVLLTQYILASLLIHKIILVIIMNACICQSTQLTPIGNKFNFFQHGHLLHVSIWFQTSALVSIQTNRARFNRDSIKYI